MDIHTINERLTAAGCTCQLWQERRVYVTSTPNGGSGSYGYCVAAEDVRDITENITKRRGEISALLRE